MQKDLINESFRNNASVNSFVVPMGLDQGLQTTARGPEPARQSFPSGPPRRFTNAAN